MNELDNDLIYLKGRARYRFEGFYRDRMHQA